MFIHLGENIMIRLKEIIAIISYDLLAESEVLKEFVEHNRKKHKIVEISAGTTKSIVVTKSAVYLSPLGASTLKRRSHL
ncbi:extracellular matrix regulator RemB [Calidifontibacillus erzurumensis]|uniref:extracellular matrix regulator RemB n=1 Tax=Calidifontibacillus erzurumensis TaxID=2741433 RepID=UPI0035B5274F